MTETGLLTRSCLRNISMLIRQDGNDILSFSFHVKTKPMVHAPVGWVGGVCVALIVPYCKNDFFSFFQMFLLEGFL